MRCACIDIGSNTTRLLVAEPDPARPGRLIEIAAHRAFVRLSAEERRSGVPPEKAAAIAEAVAEQALTARAHDIRALRVVATAALRDAPDREQLLGRIAEAAGVEVEVISGEEEARLAFAGATAGLEPDGGVVLVADVGGGSTELAAGTPGSPPGWWASVPIGSGSLTEAHLHDDPPSPPQLDAARAHAGRAIGGARPPEVDVAWMVGGGATSLRRLCGGHLDPAAVHLVLERLLAGPAFAVALDLDLHVERVRLLPAALLVLEAIGRCAACTVRVGGGGLREGVVLDLLARVR